MQVRNVPVLLCRLTGLWVTLTGAVLPGNYFIGLAVQPGPPPETYRLA